MYPWWDSHILHCTRWNYLSSCSVLTWQRMHVDFDLWWSHLLYRGPPQSVLSIHWVHHSTSTHTLYCNPSFCTLCSNGKSSTQAFFRMIQCSPVPGSKIPGPVGRTIPSVGHAVSPPQTSDGLHHPTSGHWGPWLLVIWAAGGITFLVEICLRWMSYARCVRALQDGWFLFAPG